MILSETNKNSRFLNFQIYGLSIKEVKDKKLGRFFICKSKLESSSEYEYTPEQRLELKLLFIVLSYIYMKGDTVLECRSNQNILNIISELNH